jgi:Flp pilus assembly protein TadB
MYLNLKKDTTQRHWVIKNKVSRFMPDISTENLDRHLQTAQISHSISHLRFLISSLLILIFIFSVHITIIFLKILFILTCGFLFLSLFSAFFGS